MKPLRVWRAIAAAAVLASALGGCGSKVTTENYDRIVPGMKEDQVGSILGIADESRNTTVRVQDTNFTQSQTRWRGDKGTIVVIFLNGEVQSKRYFPPGQEPKPERR